MPKLRRRPADENADELFKKLIGKVEVHRVWIPGHSVAMYPPYGSGKNSKIKPHQITEMRRLARQGMTIKTIARRFGITAGYAGVLINRAGYGYVRVTLK